MPRDFGYASKKIARSIFDETDIGVLITHAPDPDPALAIDNPERLLAFLLVSPRPCAALDRLLCVATENYNPGTDRSSGSQ